MDKHLEIVKDLIKQVFEANSFVLVDASKMPDNLKQSEDITNKPKQEEIKNFIEKSCGVPVELLGDVDLSFLDPEKESNLSLVEKVEQLKKFDLFKYLTNELIKAETAQIKKDAAKSSEEKKDVKKKINCINIKDIPGRIYGSLRRDSEVKCECVYHELEERLYIASKSKEDLIAAFPEDFVNDGLLSIKFNITYRVYYCIVSCTALLGYDCEQIYF